MSLFSGISINGKHSFRDFNLLIKDQLIGIPAKRVNFVSVPYMLGHYDFSKISGDLFFDSRVISFKFDLLEDSCYDLECLKSDVLSWLFEVHDADIFIDSIPDWHFKGSCSSASWIEDEEYGEISVEFTCYPFKIKNFAVVKSFSAGSYVVFNEFRKVHVSVSSSSDMSIKLGNVLESVCNSSKVLSSPLEHGLNDIVVSGDGILVFSFVEEVI